MCDAVGGWGGGAPERGPLGQSVAKPRPLGLPHTPAVACGGGPGVTWGPTAVGARAPQLPPNHCHPAQLGSLGRWVLSQIGGGAVLAAPRGLCTSWAREQDPPISYDGRQSCPSGAHGQRWQAVGWSGGEATGGCAWHRAAWHRAPSCAKAGQRNSPAGVRTMRVLGVISTGTGRPAARGAVGQAGGRQRSADGRQSSPVPLAKLPPGQPNSVDSGENWLWRGLCSRTRAVHYLRTNRYV